MILLSRIVLVACVCDFVFMFYCIATGFPPEVAGVAIKLKNIRTPFIAGMSLLIASVALRPDRLTVMARWREKIDRFAAQPYAVWIVFGLFSLLFLWQQISQYLAVDINFIPFSFYDYMLYHFFQGKINYTGLLHHYYHVNNILYLFAPFWVAVKSPWLLVVSYGVIAALPVFPLYGVAKDRFGHAAAGLAVTLLYCNYRYLQNVLLMNFSVEIFYPLFIFSCVYFALRNRWVGYYSCLALGLCVKEDSFLYFSALGALVFFLPGRNKLHGAVTALMSVLYFAFITMVFMPATGNAILSGDLRNFSGAGEGVGEIVLNLLKNPVGMFNVLFGEPEKMKTFFNLVYRLLFLPLLSPSVLLVLVALFPLFFQSSDIHGHFVGLRFHYAAAVIPFVFVAFIYGYSNLCRWIKSDRWRRAFFWTSFLVMLLLNVGHYRTSRITGENLESIAWARSIPAGAVVVTHGHLLPYVGYRKYNFYYADPWTWAHHPMNKVFKNADYYLIDLNVNLYPWNADRMRAEIGALNANEDYELIRRDRDVRYLYKRRELSEASDG